MKLSVVIPIYNADRYLSECLSSVAASGIADMECLLVDDCSSDSSCAICQQYVEADSRFRLLRQLVNGGVSRARNAGLEAAKGQYILFLDADDYMEPSAWDGMERASESCCDFTAFSYYTLFADRSLQEEHFAIHGESCTDPTRIREILYASSALNTCWGKLFRRDLIEQHGLSFREDLKIGEDFVFVAAYFRHCQTAALYNRPAVYYRQHRGSAMRAYDIYTRFSYMDELFYFTKREVLACSDSRLTSLFYTYYFRVVTNLLLEFSPGSGLVPLAGKIGEALRRESVREVLASMSIHQLPAYKKAEALLFRTGSSALLASYFAMKSRVRAFR